MKARTRQILTVAALAYLAAVGYLSTVLPLRTVNALLVAAVVPLLWLIATFARWSAHQHATNYQRDVDKIHGRRPEHRGEHVR